MVKKQYYCLAVRRSYEDVWRIVDKFDTEAEAQTARDERRAYTGVFNYNNAEFRIISREQGKQEFGARWEYHPIGEILPPPKVRKAAASK
jgi:hypothetical protein